MIARCCLCRLALSGLVLGGLLMTTTPAMAQEVKDSEAATHGFGAASYQVKGTYEFPGFKIIQFELGVLSHYSYILISGAEALVIDPGRDVGTYIETAAREQARIAGVYLTHSHADFVAGHMELAQQTTIYMSVKTGAQFPHTPLHEGDTLQVGEAVLRFLETPGHTPDSTTALVAGAQQPDRPRMMFTGDTLFIGSVGRPDLLGADMAASTLASMMFDTWTDKLSKLPDEVMIFPAHGAGSLCGAHLSDEPTSTLGEQRVSNPYLAHETRGEFIAAVLEGLPEAPQYFQHNARINHDGPELVNWQPDALPLVQPGPELMDAVQSYVVDIRRAAEYSAAHIPNSVNIDVRGRFETWVGTMVPWDARLFLCGGEQDLREALTRLHRVGYNRADNPVACVTFEAWQQAGLPTRSNEMIAPQKLYAQMQSQESPVVLDVRLPNEWMGVRIGTVLNIPLNALATQSVKLDRRQAVVTVCNSAYRSNMAVGILERAGFEQVASLAGGGEAWIAAGLPVIEAQRDAASAGAVTREIRLAQRISAAELKRLLMDLPGTFELVDIRPPVQFADYSLPESKNVDIADILNNPAYLTGAGPLVIVDRDGTLAMMVGGILSQKTQRAVQVLYGGLAGYWSDTELAPAAAVPGGTPAAAGPAPAAPPAPAAGQPAAPAKPRKRSAGC